MQELNVEVGSSVSKGNILAVVEHEELKLGVRQAKAGLRQAEALSKINIISQVEQAQAGLSAAIDSRGHRLRSSMFARAETIPE